MPCGRVRLGQSSVGPACLLVCLAATVCWLPGCRPPGNREPDREARPGTLGPHAPKTKAEAAAAASPDPHCAPAIAFIAFGRDYEEPIQVVRLEGERFAARFTHPRDYTFIPAMAYDASGRKLYLAHPRHRLVLQADGTLLSRLHRKQDIHEEFFCVDAQNHLWSVHRDRPRPTPQRLMWSRLPFEQVERSLELPETAAHPVPAAAGGDSRWRGISFFAESSSPYGPPVFAIGPVGRGGETVLWRWHADGRMEVIGFPESERGHVYTAYQLHAMGANRLLMVYQKGEEHRPYDYYVAVWDGQWTRLRDSAGRPLKVNRFSGGRVNIRATIIETPSGEIVLATTEQSRARRSRREPDHWVLRVQRYDAREKRFERLGYEPRPGELCRRPDSYKADPWLWLHRGRLHLSWTEGDPHARLFVVALHQEGWREVGSRNRRGGGIFPKLDPVFFNYAVAQCPGADRVSAGSTDRADGRFPDGSAE